MLLQMIIEFCELHSQLGICLTASEQHLNAANILQKNLLKFVCKQTTCKCFVYACYYLCVCA